MKKPAQKMWIALVAALAAVISVSLFYAHYRSEVTAQHRLMLERGRTILDSLAAGIRAQTRMGRYSEDRLAAIFEELAQSDGIIAVRMDSPGGETIAQAGKMDALAQAPYTSPVWQQDCLYISQKALLAGHRGAGMGMGPPAGRGGLGRAMMQAEIPWNAGEYTLSAALDTGSMRNEIRHERIYVVFSSGASVLAVAAAALVVLARQRQRDLHTALLLSEERAAQGERLAQLGAGLAHETKNPLGVVRGFAQSIADAAGGHPEINKMAQAIIDEADRTVGQINSFLTLARPLEPVLERVSLDSFFSKMLPLLEGEAYGTEVVFSYEPCGFEVMADRSMLRRAVLNLAINALRACDKQGHVVAAAEADYDGVTLSIRDTGRGIAPEDLPRVADPYFSRFEGGSGLGLAIVDQIARVHGWRLTVESQPGKGTEAALHGLVKVQ